MKFTTYFLFLAVCIFRLEDVVATKSYKDLRSRILRKATARVTFSSRDLLYLFKNPTVRGGNRNNPVDIAQATCVALAPNGWASAVPRNCHARTPCTTICARATPKIKKAIGNQGARTATCFNTLHFYYAAVVPENKGKAHMTMYKYGGACGSTGCGPNFCCCKV